MRVLLMTVAPPLFIFARRRRARLTALLRLFIHYLRHFFACAAFARYVFRRHAAAMFRLRTLRALPSFLSFAAYARHTYSRDSP